MCRCLCRHVSAPLFGSICVCVIYLWWQISDSVLAGGRAEPAGRDGAGLSQYAEDTLESCRTLALHVRLCGRALGIRPMCRLTCSKTSGILNHQQENGEFTVLKIILHSNQMLIASSVLLSSSSLWSAHMCTDMFSMFILYVCPCNLSHVCVSISSIL